MTEERISLLKRSAGKFLAFGFVLVFLFAQSTSLLHSHAGDLKRHIDCELCLKVGSGDDALVAAHSVVVPDTSIAYSTPLPVLAASLQPVAAKSRSPPQSL
ncbi:MAG: hypothetical protein A3H44_08190 [Gammaproteobacteria bacterium RIFCSPLOWO2_02_FULL_57_10]|nr:MAG: hypothetical protein A3H44_08190 [Gammaproteobacteria bacterium RIFCSPLOWO2_02_FULL_57_10]